MTGQRDGRQRDRSRQAGALDYLDETVRFRAPSRAVDDGARGPRAPRAPARASMPTVAKQFEFYGMIGRSPVMQELFDSIRRLAPHVRTVLVTGETGTGKELVAGRCTSSGRGARSALVTVNCSAVVETLFESELFGHVRGAFTGADRQQGRPVRARRRRHALSRRGRRAAAGAAGQAAARRRVRRGSARRVAARRGVSTCASIAATNRDLRADVGGGPVPQRSLLSSQHHRVHAAAAARAARGHPVSDGRVRPRVSPPGSNEPITGITPAAERLLQQAPGRATFASCATSSSGPAS